MDDFKITAGDFSSDEDVKKNHSLELIKMAQGGSEKAFFELKEL